ncbi:MAG: ABC transporter substrate-binding protein [Desulfovibrionaceae bacterium]|nr:ABC transporter substrate-binding protein [Desulfovibrionaceae bacterium]MBF0512763.1 ABC transporter substrate-binding protein [Desulfovibrionaceae bacterium]
MLTYRLRLLLAVLAGLACACPALAGDAVRIAVPAAYTGNVAAYGDNIKAGVTLKVEEINAKGGVGGVKLEALFLDEQCEPREAATVAAKIVQDESVAAVIGHLCSSAHLAALPAYIKAGLPALSPTATNIAISEKNKDKQGETWSFRTIYRDDFQGRFLARYIARVMGLRRVAVFHDMNDYGLGLAEAFQAEARSLGLTVTGVEAYLKGAQDFTAQLTKIKAADPDALFIAGYSAEGALIADQAAKVGLTVPKFGADGLDNEDYIKIAGPAAEGTFLTAPFLAEAAGPEAAAFIDAFKARFKRDPDYMSANAYDATGLIAGVLANTGPARDKVREALAAMNSKDTAYFGVTGPTFFDHNGDCQKPAFVKTVADRKFVAAPLQMAHDD